MLGTDTSKSLSNGSRAKPHVYKCCRRAWGALQCISRLASVGWAVKHRCHRIPHKATLQQTQPNTTMQLSFKNPAWNKLISYMKPLPLSGQVFKVMGDRVEKWERTNKVWTLPLKKKWLVEGEVTIFYFSFSTFFWANWEVILVNDFLFFDS